MKGNQLELNIPPLLLATNKEVAMNPNLTITVTNYNPFFYTA